MKTDYSEELRNLIDRNYAPVDSVMQDDEYTVKKTLTALHKEVTNILPSLWVQEADVYEALEELGFKSFLFNFPQEVNQEGEVISEEYQKMVYLLERKTAAL